MATVELNPFSWDFHEDPHPVYRRLRDEAPLYRNDALGFWALSRYVDVRDALVDWQTYSSAEGTTVERMDPAVLALKPMMIFLDPPRHDRLRKLVSRGFTPRRTAELEGFVRATAVRLLDALAARGGGDVVADLSSPLPMDVIFTLLGVPAPDRARMRHQMDVALERDRDSPAVPPRAIEAMASMMMYWHELIASLRRRPDDALISALIAAEVETEDGGRTRLTDDEIVGFCALLGAAGNETVTKLLAGAVVLFSRHPEEYAKIVADPGRIPDAVEEALRHVSPSQYQGRVTTRDVCWYGTTVPAGERILLFTGSANHDEREFADPGRFDVSRRPENHVALGYGTHFCLGASLARLESRIALEELVRRFPRVVVDEAGCERVHMSNVHGFARVPFARAT